MACGLSRKPPSRRAVCSATWGKRRSVPPAIAHAVRAGCRSIRRREVERVQLAAGDGTRLSSGAEIVRLNIGAGSGEVHGPPLPPSALVAAVRLLVRDPLSQRFNETAEPRRKDAGRLARGAMHSLGS